MATHITNATELQAINSNLSGDYILDNDIDLTGVTWSPIGQQVSPGNFTGTFDGQGFVIRNLTMNINRTAFVSAGAEFGLFGSVANDAEISNLGLDNVVLNVIGTNNANVRWIGGFCGLFTPSSVISNCYATNVTLNITAASTCTVLQNGLFMGVFDPFESTVEDCYCSGEININYPGQAEYIGGLAGLQSGYDSAFINCHSICDINIENGGQYVGVFSGYFNNFSNTMSLTNCYAEGDITIGDGDSREIGGFSGVIACSELSDCYYNGNISIGNGSHTLIGLFTGIISSHDIDSISNCYARGNIEIGTGSLSNLGGFCGRLSADVFSLNVVENCYYIGDITINGSGASSNIGSFIGYTSGSEALSYYIVIKKCYSDCNLNFIDITSTVEDVGGFIGESEMPINTLNCYCKGEINVDCSGNAQNIGGFVGNISVNNAIHNSYSAVNISVESSSGTISDIGGFIGYFDGYDLIKNCFSSSIITAEGTNIGGFGGTISNSEDIMQNCAWYVIGSRYAIGYANQDGDPVERFITNNLGTDELDQDNFKNTTDHTVFAQV